MRKSIVWAGLWCMVLCGCGGAGGKVVKDQQVTDSTDARSDFVADTGTPEVVRKDTVDTVVPDVEGDAGGLPDLAVKDAAAETVEETAAAVCGNNVCEPGESPENCAEDCVHCGDGFCNLEYEDCQSCPADCTVCPECGNELCEYGEGPEVCAFDCGWCGDGMCGAGETSENAFCWLDCSVVCGNKQCEEGESAVEGAGVYCPIDCPACGDGICSWPELLDPEVDDCGDCSSLCGNGVCEDEQEVLHCPPDCPVCGDGFCSFIDTQMEDCPQDCVAPCGDGHCTGGETFATCPVDCGYCGDGICAWKELIVGSCQDDCAPDCGDGVCKPTESEETCFIDCGCFPVCVPDWECGEDLNGCGETCAACPHGGWECDGHECACALEEGGCSCTEDTVGKLEPCANTNQHGTCWGEHVCGPDGWAPCDAQVPAEEDCNGLDDNCNGAVEEGVKNKLCFNENEYGTCIGLDVCGEGGWSGCDAQVPGPEECNLADENCNGQIDEDVVETECENSNDYGSCAGFSTCVAGKVACDAATPMPESCNGADDNCDGFADEGYPNLDGDALADCVDDDDDGDGVLDTIDNCPLIPNALQTNSDGFPDGGDACDPDDDNDGHMDPGDNCPLVYNPLQEDSDQDGLGDVCDGDKDGDGKSDDIDNCPFVANPDQADLDEDGSGDACDPDDDGDGFADGDDCQPLDLLSFPGAPELCDGVDNDCDNLTDEGVMSSCGNCDSTCYQASVGPTGDKPFQCLLPGDCKQVEIDFDGHLGPELHWVDSEFMWIPTSGNGRIVKLDVATGKQVAAYGGFSNPVGVSTDSDGFAWLTSSGDGRVVKIAPDKVYCQDKDQNGSVETSADGDDNGTISDAEIVPDDECIVVDTLPGGATQQCVDVDSQDSPWVGELDAKVVRRLDPFTGEVLETVPLEVSPGSLAVGTPDQVWILGRKECAVELVSTGAGVVKSYAVPACQPDELHGITIDAQGGAWFSGTSNCRIYRVKPGDQDVQVVQDDCASGDPFGLTFSNNGVYVVHGASTCQGTVSVTRIEATTQASTVLADTLPQGDGWQSAIGLDLAQNMWITNTCANSVLKLGPEGNALGIFPVDASPSAGGHRLVRRVLAWPYVPNKATWEHTFAGNPVGSTTWSLFFLEADTPGDANLAVQFKSAMESGELDSQEWTAPSGPFPPGELPMSLSEIPGLDGKLLKVRLILQADAQGSYPTVHAVGVQSQWP